MFVISMYQETNKNTCVNVRLATFTHVFKWRCVMILAMHKNLNIEQLALCLWLQLPLVRSWNAIHLYCQNSDFINDLYWHCSVYIFHIKKISIFRVTATTGEIFLGSNSETQQHSQTVCKGVQRNMIPKFILFLIWGWQPKLYKYQFNIHYVKSDLQHKEA